MDKSIECCIVKRESHSKTLRLEHVRVLTHYERSGAVTGDDNVFRYSFVKTLYLSHYTSGAERAVTSGAERIPL